MLEMSYTFFRSVQSLLLLDVTALENPNFQVTKSINELGDYLRAHFPSSLLLNVGS